MGTPRDPVARTLTLSHPYSRWGNDTFVLRGQEPVWGFRGDHERPYALLPEGLFRDLEPGAWQACPPGLQLMQHQPVFLQ